MSDLPDIDIEAERMDFEAYIRAECSNMSLKRDTTSPDEDYWWVETEDAWQPWKHRARIAAERERYLLDQIAIYNRMWNELRGILRVEVPLPQGTTVAEFDYQPPLIERAKHMQAELARLRTLEAAAIESGLQRLRKEIAEYEAFVNRDPEHQEAEKARKQ